jgi:hypothetical protein
VNIYHSLKPPACSFAVDKVSDRECLNAPEASKRN